MTSPWIRRIAIAAGVLVLLVVVAAGVLLATFDANRYKSLAIDWMKTTHQRTLAIDGPIELSLFPRLAVKVSRLRLSERGRDDEFVAVDEAALAVQVLPLLSRQLVVGRIAARGLRASYLRDDQGVRNFDDLFSADTGAKAPGQAPGPAGADLRFDVGAVQFDDVRLRVNDRTARVAGDVVLQSFSSGRLADRTDSPVTLRATVTLTEPQALALTLDGRGTLSFDLERRSVALGGLTLAVDGETAALKAFAGSLEGALAWDGGAISAGPLRLTIKSATLGTTKLAPSTAEVAKLLFDPDRQRLELQTLKVALAGRQGADPFELALDWPQLAVDAKRLEGSAMSGRAKMLGANALTATFRSAAPGGSFDALRLPGLELSVNGQTGARKVDANARAELLLELARGAAALERLDLKATLADPGLQPLQVAAQGSAGADAKSAQWRLDGTLNGNRFSTQGQAVLGGAVPVVKASARFEDLDLNGLLAPNQPTPTTTATPPVDTPVPYDALKAVDGEFALEAGALAFRQYRFSDARVAATLSRGSLRVSRLDARAWGGSVTGSGSADAGSRRVALKLAAEGVNVNPLLKDVAGKDLLEGTGRVTADLQSGGAGVGALRSSLVGSAAVQLRNGAVKGFNLARTLRQAKAALSLQQDAVTRARETEKTDFSELNMSARIADGVAQSDDLDLKSPFLRVGGAGRFDIGRGRIDYTARATVTASATGQDGAGLEALRGVTVPVLLSGPFEAIDWKIQWSAVASAAVKDKLKDKLTEALGARLGVPPAGADAAASAPAPARPQDVLRDQVKDRLKGLFK
jgi:AsmA protein